MSNPKINKLGPASGANYIGITDGAGIQGYKQLDPSYFSVGGDIENKTMSYINDEEGTLGGGPSPVSPLNPPSSPALNATLVEKFDDYEYSWRWNGATWDFLSYDPRMITLQVFYSAQGTSTAFGGLVIPSIYNNWKFKTLTVGNNSITPIGPSTIMLSGYPPTQVAFGPTATFGANATTSVAAGLGAITGGTFIQVDPAVMPAAPCVVALVLTLQRP